MLHGTLVVEPAGAESLPAPGAGAGKGHTHEVARAVGVGPTLEVGKTRRVEFALRGGGVTCPTCVRNIEGALNRVAGVDRVQANFGAERVTVDFDPTRVEVPDLARGRRRGGLSGGGAPGPGLAGDGRPRGGGAPVPRSPTCPAG